MIEEPEAPKERAASSTTAKEPGKRKTVSRGTKSYSAMIEEALISHGGQATYKEITDYIAEKCKEDIAERKTWRNSVGGMRFEEDDMSRCIVFASTV